MCRALTVQWMLQLLHGVPELQLVDGVGHVEPTILPLLQQV